MQPSILRRHRYHLIEEVSVGDRIRDFLDSVRQSYRTKWAPGMAARLSPDEEYNFICAPPAPRPLLVAAA